MVAIKAANVLGGLVPRLTRRVTSVVAGVLSLAMTSCKSMRSYPSVDAAMMDKPSTVYVMQTDGSRITLTKPVIKGDSLTGFVSDQGTLQPKQIALSDIAVVAAKKGMSPTRLLVGALVLAVLGVGEIVLLR